jgi:Fe-S-cluster containining protein
MKLDVLQAGADTWFAGGLRFECTQCGNCCTGEPGYVWISIEEVGRLARHLRLDPQDVIDRYCRKLDGKLSLRERRNARGDHDCIFLEEQPGRRICTVYPVRPLQCRTWPFWDSNLQDEARWKRAASRCPGIGSGRRYSASEIVALRDARDWPQEHQ